MTFRVLGLNCTVVDRTCQESARTSVSVMLLPPFFKSVLYPETS